MATSPPLAAVLLLGAAAAGSWETSSCPPGKHVEEGGAGCAKCEAGKYSDTAGQVACTSCLPGSYASEVGMTACVTAVAGSQPIEETDGNPFMREADGTVPRALTAPCVDTDAGAADPWGNTCSGIYSDIVNMCGKFDDEDFSSILMCCSCSSLLEPAPAPPPGDDPTPGPTLPPGTEIVTSMMGAHSLGASSLIVASEAGLQVGQRLLISGGGNSEQKSIIGFGSILLDSPLIYSYGHGATVAVLTTSTTTTGTTTATTVTATTTSTRTSLTATETTSATTTTGTATTTTVTTATTTSTTISTWTASTTTVTISATTATATATTTTATASTTTMTTTSTITTASVTATTSTTMTTETNSTWTTGTETNSTSTTGTETMTSTSTFSSATYLGPAPTPAPFTLEDLSDAENGVVAALLSGNASSAVLESKGVTIVAAALSPDSGENITVGVPGSVQVTFPSSMFAALGEANVVATMSVGASLADVAPSTSSDDKPPVTVKSVISINIMSMNGEGIAVAGLPEPITFSMPNATDGGLYCGWLDEATGEWRTDGTWPLGIDPETGNLICATVHLSFFGALLDGLLATLECSQASLMTPEGYRELAKVGEWTTTVGAQLLFGLLSIIISVFACACYADYREAKQDFWKPEYFLVAERSGPPVAAAGVGAALAAEAAAEGGCFGGCGDLIEACKAAVWEALDDLASSFFEFAGDIRGLLDELWAAMATGETKGPDPFTKMTLALVEVNVHKQACAASFFHPDDAELLFDDSVEELLGEGEESEQGEGEGDQSPDGAQSPGGDRSSVGGQSSCSVGVKDVRYDMDVDSLAVGQAAATAAAVPAGRAKAADDFAGGLQALPNPGSEPVGRGGEGEGEAAEECASPASGEEPKVILRPGDVRHERLTAWRAYIMDHKRQQTNHHGSWCSMHRFGVMNLLVHNPMSQVFCRSILCSHSLRALLLACDWLGAAMLATFFTSASGGAMGKRMPKGCDMSCEERAADKGEDAISYCIAFTMGRIIAIGSVSAVVASVPVGLISSLHSREFKRIDYEGSPDWNAQLASWRRKDIATWIVGTAYCLFAVHFMMLFFANVGEEDQADWMLSAAIGFFQDFILLPFISGIFLAVVAMMLLGFLACRYGIGKKHFVKHGDVGAVREMFHHAKKKDHVHEALNHSEGLHSFNKFTRSQSLRDFGSGVSKTLSENSPPSRNRSKTSAGSKERADAEALEVALGAVGAPRRSCNVCGCVLGQRTSPRAGSSSSEGVEDLCDVCSASIDGMMAAADQEAHVVSMSTNLHLGRSRTRTSFGSEASIYGSEAQSFYNSEASHVDAPRASERKKSSVSTKSYARSERGRGGVASQPLRGGSNDSGLPQALVEP